MCNWKLKTTNSPSCEWNDYINLSGGFYDMSRTCITKSWISSDDKFMQS